MNTKWCRQYQEALYGSAEETLPPEVLKHAEQCAVCRAALNEIQTLHHDVESLCALQHQNAPVVDLVDAVMRGLDEVKSGRRVLAPLEFADSVELMAYIEGELPPQAREDYEKHLSASPLLQAEVTALSALHAECEAMGAEEFAKLPQVDLTDDILRRIQAVQSPAPKVVPFRARPRVQAPAAQPRFRWSWALLAAAACLVIGAVFALNLYVNQKTGMGGDSSQTARKTSPAGSFKHTQNPATIAKRKKFSDDIRRMREREPKKEEVDTVRAERLTKGISLQDAINARREALLGRKDARARFDQWGSLTPEEARQLLREPGISPDAVAALCQYLPAEEAADILRNAAKEHPEDPYLKLALSKALADTPNSVAESLAHLNALSENDPNNSMPLFMEAKLRFANDDPEGALNALTKACGLQELDSYAQEAARAREAAYLLSGMDADTARFMAGASAGSYEYSDLTKLSQNLIAQGQKYEAAGDYDTAQQIYQGVQRLGSQLVTSAAYADEQLAGYDAQHQALDALEAIYTILQDSENLQALETLYNGISDGLGQLLELILSLDSVYASNPDAVLDTMGSWLLFGNARH